MLNSNPLYIDAAAEVGRITTWLRDILVRDLHRRGLVVAISGGIDSAVCCALAARAIGPDRVFGLLLPELDSSSRSTVRGRMVAGQFISSFEEMDITPVLASLGCYRRRDDAIRRLFPEFTDGWRSKIVISGRQVGAYNQFMLVVQSPHGETFKRRCDRTTYLEIVSATNMKQRTRKSIEYFHADRLHYAVVGTPNRVEFDQGFFVKNGDGAADVKPIAHLYKTQVYMLARYLGISEEILAATPTTDTYSLEQDQGEFYFSLPYEKMDLALYLYNNGANDADLADALGIPVSDAALIFKDIATKRRTTAPLHWHPLLIEDVAIDLPPAPKPLLLRFDRPASRPPT